MSSKNSILAELLTLSHHLGDPSHDWAVLGEGNTSTQIDNETFFVKASGSTLATLQPDQVCEVRFAPILEALSSPTVDDAGVRDLLLSSTVGGTGKMPSVETLFHAYLLSLPEVTFVGHTHVASINGITCSEGGWKMLSENATRLFPDEIVVCGEAPCCVPYVDPGFTLAREIRLKIEAYIERYGIYPKGVYMQNHGFIALGRNAKEVEAIHIMADKAARVLTWTMSFGGPNWFTSETIQRIATRPDEKYRQKAIVQKS